MVTVFNYQLARAIFEGYWFGHFDQRNHSIMQENVTLLIWYVHDNSINVWAAFNLFYTCALLSLIWYN